MPKLALKRTDTQSQVVLETNGILLEPTCAFWATVSFGTKSTNFGLSEPMSDLYLRYGGHFWVVRPSLGFLRFCSVLDLSGPKTNYEPTSRPGRLSRSSQRFNLILVRAIISKPRKMRGGWGCLECLQVSPDTVRNIMIITAHQETRITSTPHSQNVIYDPSPRPSESKIPTTPHKILPTALWGQMFHNLEPLDLCVSSLLMGHASMALTVHFSDLCWQRHSSSSESSPDEEVATCCP